LTGILEEILKNKEELIIKALEVMSGKETTVRVNLDGVNFEIGGTKIKLSGDVGITIAPPPKKKKK